jgi:hypothetical protein
MDSGEKFVQYGVENRGREEKEIEMRGRGLQGWSCGGVVAVLGSGGEGVCAPVARRRRGAVRGRR